MSRTLNLRRWREAPAGVNHRRWVIVSTGLRQIFRLRFFQILVLLAWLGGLFVAVAGFVFTQTLASGGWLETWASELGPRPHAVVTAFCSLVLMYPDICIHGMFTAVFWAQSTLGLGLSLLALSVAIPRLVARDRASNALTIYLSRPLTSTDYLLGKLGIIVGIMLLLWTGPLVLGWFLSMVLVPNSDFFVHSLTPLLRAGLFNFISLVVLATVALGVSSLGKTTRSVTALWLGVWLIAGTIASIPSTPAIVRAASFSYDLQEVRKSVFKLDDIFVKAGKTLPISNREFSETLVRIGESQSAEHIYLADLGLLVLVVGSLSVFLRRIRPE